MLFHTVIAHYWLYSVKANSFFFIRYDIKDNLTIK